MTNQSLVVAGSGLIVLGLTPTPDDVTVISPALQIIGGLILLGIGLVKK